MSGPAAFEPHRSIEVERTYDTAEDTPLPDWTGLPGVARVGATEVRELDARYFDTAALDLARAGVAVRRREGGPDAGWHVKAPAGADRSEWGWPLGDGGDTAVPPAVAEAVAEWATPPFSLLARIRNTRTAYALCDHDGALVAEFVDDRVRGLDERRGVVSAWREWEVELGPAAAQGEAARAAFFAAVEAAVTDAGGRPAASDSKLRRVIEHRVIEH